jgi:hypothetical protein
MSKEACRHFADRCGSCPFGRNRFGKHATLMAVGKNHRGRKGNLKQILGPMKLNEEREQQPL